MDVILGFLWPPYGFQLRKQKFFAKLAKEQAEYYRTVVIAYWTEQYPKEQLKLFNTPFLFKQFTEESHKSK